LKTAVIIDNNQKEEDDRRRESMKELIDDFINENISKDARIL
jgi:hypothetical protein